MHIQLAQVVLGGGGDYDARDLLTDLTTDQVDDLLALLKQRDDTDKAISAFKKTHRFDLTKAIEAASANGTK